MSTSHASRLSKRQTLFLLPCLLIGMSLAAAAASEPPAAAPSVSAYQPGRLPLAYRVVNLGPGDVTGVQINDSGQVAYALSTTGPTRNFFYDGSRITEIRVPGAEQVATIALNNAGQVAGTSFNARTRTFQGYVWTRAGGFVNIRPPYGRDAWTIDINNRGQVAGGFYTANFQTRAYRWSAAIGAESVGVLPGTDPATSFTSPTVISDSGLVAGWGNSAAGPEHAFAWTRRTGVIDLGTFGGANSFAIDADVYGQVVGYATVPGNLRHAFLWNRQQGLLDLGTGGGTESSALAINDKGQQVAGTIDFPGFQRAFSWTRASGMVALGTLGGLTSYAWDVNNQGQVVGGADIPANGPHAFVWTAQEGMIDLNTRLRHAPRGLALYSAIAISNNGAIVAISNAGLVLLKPDCSCTGPHTAGPITGADMVEVGTPFESTVSFAGADTAARYHVTWSWGDGSGDEAGSAIQSKGVGNASGQHRYAMPGIYTVLARVTDLGGNSAVVARSVVAYDKNGGALRGSGSFMSPQGANRSNPGQAGMAVFAFFAPTIADARAGAANAALHFKLGTLNFRSDEMRPVAAQAGLVRFEGTGTLNGDTKAGFRLLAADGGEGKRAAGQFALEIWHTDPVTKAQVIDYDNRRAGPDNAGVDVAGNIVLGQN